MPVKRLSLHQALDRQSWIGAAAAAGRVAVIKDREIIGNDAVAGAFSQEVMDMFMATSRAALSVAVEHGITLSGLIKQ